MKIIGAFLLTIMISVIVEACITSIEHGKAQKEREGERDEDN